MREAVRVLEALGIVKVSRGAENGGVHLREEPGNAFTYLLRLYLSLQHASLTDVIDFLILTSSWATRIAASGRGNVEALRELEEIVDCMGDDSLDPTQWQQIDAAFHSTIVKASDNAVAVLVLDGCMDSLKRLIFTAITDNEDWEATRAGLVVEHARLSTPSPREIPTTQTAS